MERKHKRVLLVEDNDADAELVISVVTDENLALKIDRADDGEKALDILFNCYQSRDLSCIILDIKLPKIDGLEVLKIIKNNEIYKNTPVVVFTSSAEERDIESGYKHGANAYVVKPLDFVQYREAVYPLEILV